MGPEAGGYNMPAVLSFELLQVVATGYQQRSGR